MAPQKRWPTISSTGWRTNRYQPIGNQHSRGSGVGLVGIVVSMDGSSLPYNVQFEDGKSFWCGKVDFLWRKCTCDLWSVLMVTGCKCGAAEREKEEVKREA